MEANEGKGRDAWLSDEAIIDLFFARNEEAIIESDRKYGAYLLSVAHNILKNYPDSEECRNDAYLHAWNSIPPTRPSSLGAYLTKLIRSVAVNRYRHDRREKRIPPEVVESLADFKGVLTSPAPDDESEVIGEILSRYLRRVSRRRRYIFMARYFAVKPVSAIAEQLGVSESTVKKTLTAMKKELRKELEEGGIHV